nr:MAG TPA: hypothetical protein [Caudoviricetes sp.]
MIYKTISREVFQNYKTHLTYLLSLKELMLYA